MDKHLQTAEKLTKILDNEFKIAGFKFGLDPILGLLPVLGDIVPALLSFYLVWIGWQMKLPMEKIFIMIANVLIDYLVGSIPVLGDAVDFFFKANTRNLKILQSSLNSYPKLN
jgi:hypothetical protein